MHSSMVGSPAGSVADSKRARRDTDATRRAQRDASLAEAQAAEQEAVAASADRDAAADRVRLALAKAAMARADAAAVDPQDPPPKDGDDDMAIPNAMLVHEAASILNLHAQTFSLHNPRSLVSFLLDTTGNYPR